MLLSCINPRAFFEPPCEEVRQRTKKGASRLESDKVSTNPLHNFTPLLRAVVETRPNLGIPSDTSRGFQRPCQKPPPERFCR